jgi:phosphoribosyl 1,2-cyclic phosphodiesterase
MEIRFWGVRGSVAASGEAVARVGGNTSCVEVVHGGERLIFDAGTGIRALGEALLHEGRPCRAAIFFSHLHWDHLQGFPFFGPAYLPATELALHGPGPDGASELQSALMRQMQPPGFPVTLDAMRGTRHFFAAEHGRPIRIGPFTVTPFALPHPQGSMGYRVEAGGAVFVYATDVELTAHGLPADIADGMRGADALCLDAQYTPDEYEGRTGPSKRGWGHSTMLDAARIAQAVGAKRLFLFHHDPAHNDAAVESMAAAAREIFAPAEPAREGARIVLEANAVPQVA